MSMTDEEKSLERNAAIILAGIAAAPQSNTFKISAKEQVEEALGIARKLRASFMEKK